MSALDEMKARAAAATQSPWIFSEGYHECRGGTYYDVSPKIGAKAICQPFSEADGIFIAHAPEDQAKLIAVVEEIQSVKRFEEQDRAVVISSGDKQRTVVKSAEFAAGYDEALREIQALIAASLG